MPFTHSEIKRLRTDKTRGIRRPRRAEIEAWRTLLDTEQTSVREFLESYEIATKRVGEGGSVMVPFRLRPAQEIILSEMERQWAEGKGAKIIIVKDRQQGCSTLIQGLMWERFLRGGGGNGKTVSHKDDATDELAKTLTSFRRQTPAWLWPHVGIEWVSQQADQLEIVVERRIPTSVKTLTCRDDAMGRGSAVRWFHISEYPWWATGKGNLGGALEAWDDTPGNFVILESTGRNFDEFYDIVCAAQEGKNGYTLIFLSWLTHPQKTLPFKTPAERDGFIESIGKIDRYGGTEELDLAEKHGATPEQLHWRREKIDSPEIAGQLEIFRREHPAILGDAFLAESDTVFDIRVLDSRRKHAEDIEAKCRRGNIELVDASPEATLVAPGERRPFIKKTSSVRFVDNPRGCLRIYQPPVKGRSYAFGADPAEGRKVVDQGKREGDFSTICVVDIEDGNPCAIYRQHVPPEPFAIDVFALAWYYNARGYIERNKDGLTTLNEFIDVESWWTMPRDVGTFLLSQGKLVPTRFGDQWEFFPGFLTDAGSKPVLVNRAVRWTREMGVLANGTSDKWRLPLPMMNEMRLYTKKVNISPRTGQPTGRVTLGVEKGHDDVAMAFFLALEAAHVLRERPEERVAYEPMPEMDATMIRLLAEEQRERSHTVQRIGAKIGDGGYVSTVVTERVEPKSGDPQLGSQF